jgi:hypothetical protein
VSGVEVTGTTGSERATDRFGVEWGLAAVWVELTACVLAAVWVGLTVWFLAADRDGEGDTAARSTLAWRIPPGCPPRA